MDLLDSFKFDFGGADLDFDLSDFSLITSDEISLDDRPNNVRYWKPRADVREVLRKGNYKYAKDFVKNVDLAKGARTYAWIDGSFVFGDIIEAFAAEDIIYPKRVFFSTLSMNQENIDSLRNCIDYFGLEQLDIVLSDYFYSHEKNNLIPYLYKTLDVGNILQVAFAHVHTKIIGIETHRGNKVLIHGSANMRTCGAIEQICCECNDELYDFNAQIVDEMIDKYATINKTFLGGRDTWQAVLQAEHSASGAASKAVRGRHSQGRAHSKGQKDTADR